MREVSSLDPLKAQDLASLVGKMLQGSEKARELIILSQLSQVVQIVQEFTDRGLEVEELIAEGNCGLLQAVDNYHLTGGDFQTHLRDGIKNSIILALELQAQRVKERQALTDKINSIIQAIQTRTKELDRIPTEIEVAEYLKMSHDELEYIMKLAVFLEEEKEENKETEED